MKRGLAQSDLSCAAYCGCLKLLKSDCFHRDKRSTLLHQQDFAETPHAFRGWMSQPFDVSVLRAQHSRARYYTSFAAVIPTPRPHVSTPRCAYTRVNARQVSKFLGLLVGSCRVLVRLQHSGQSMFNAQKWRLVAELQCWLIQRCSTVQCCVFAECESASQMSSVYLLKMLIHGACCAETILFCRPSHFVNMTVAFAHRGRASGNAWDTSRNRDTTAPAIQNPGFGASQDLENFPRQALNESLAW